MFKNIHHKIFMLHDLEVRHNFNSPQNHVPNCWCRHKNIIITICPTGTQIYIQQWEDWFLPVLSPLVTYTHVKSARVPDVLKQEQGGWADSSADPAVPPQTPTANAVVLSTEHFRLYGGTAQCCSVLRLHTPAKRCFHLLLISWPKFE